MKLFLDTANLDEIREITAWGVLAGVTTNPSLIAKEGRDFVATIAEICDIVKGPTSAEVIAQDPQGMIREGRMLAKISPHVVVKVPLTASGLTATRALSSEGIRVNVTLCFNPGQALLAARAGATYISPFVGRLDDVGTEGMDLIRRIVDIYQQSDLETEVLAASLRHPMHLVDAALAGAHVSTAPASVFRAVLKHPLTDSGNARFLKDWEGVPDKDIVGQVERWLASR